MRLVNIAEATISDLIGRLLRRAILFVLVGLLAAVTLYYANSAATLALAIEFGSLQAYLIMAAGYATAVIVTVFILWATRPKTVEQDALSKAQLSPRNMQIAMLVEAAALGYSLARKSSKSIS